MRSFATATALAASLCAIPSVAAPPTQPDYRAWYDAKRDVYCLHLKRPTMEVDPYPSFRGTQCRRASRWSTRGLEFSRRATRGPEVARK
jgi:hypothetical protein